MEETKTDDLLHCTICTCVFFKPTFFECGHTFCISCHYNLDKSTEAMTFEIPKFKCPVCRMTSVIPWHKRKLNHALDKICEARHPERYKRLNDKENDKENVNETDVPDPPPGLSPSSIRVNLPELSSLARSEAANEVYAVLIPLLITAARLGKSFISVTEKIIVRKIEICIRPLSKLLFANNNIYKILCSPEECTVMISRAASRWRREFRNDAHEPSDDSVSTNDDDEPNERAPSPSSPSSPSSPPPRVRLARRRRLASLSNDEALGEGLSALRRAIEIRYTRPRLLT